MAKTVISIIGPRKTGRTTAAELLVELMPDVTVTSPSYYAIQEFVKVNDMSLEEFFKETEFAEEVGFEQHKRLMFLFKESVEKIKPMYFLNQMIVEINSTPNTVILDDIYTFAELDIINRLQSKLIFIDAAYNKRLLFGYKDNMDKQFYTQDVAALTTKDVRYWKNTVVIENDTTPHGLRNKLKNLL